MEKFILMISLPRSPGSGGREGVRQKYYHIFSISRIFLNSFGVIFSLISPVSTTVIKPDSSETTTMRASVCSDIPTAALCLIPNRGGSETWSVIGSGHLAARIRPLSINTAPSCNGVFLKKIVSSNSALICALRISPPSEKISRLLFLPITISAPVLFEAIVSQALTISSASLGLPCSSLTEEKSLPNENLLLVIYLFPITRRNLLTSC